MSAALRLEAALKRLRRDQKIAVIEGRARLVLTGADKVLSLRKHAVRASPQV
jgi:predicted GIY-YIG superfamily endonuclease